MRCRSGGDDCWVSFIPSLVDIPRDKRGNAGRPRQLAEGTSSSKRRGRSEGKEQRVRNTPGNAPNSGDDPLSALELGHAGIAMFYGAAKQQHGPTDCCLDDQERRSGELATLTRRRRGIEIKNKFNFPLTARTFGWWRPSPSSTAPPPAMLSPGAGASPTNTSGLPSNMTRNAQQNHSSGRHRRARRTTANAMFRPCERLSPSGGRHGIPARWHSSVSSKLYDGAFMAERPAAQ